MWEAVLFGVLACSSLAIGGAVLRGAERAGVDAPVTARLVAELRDRQG